MSGPLGSGQGPSAPRCTDVRCRGGKWLRRERWGEGGPRCRWGGECVLETDGEVVCAAELRAGTDSEWREREKARCVFGKGPARGWRTGGVCSLHVGLCDVFVCAVEAMAMRGVGAAEHRFETVARSFDKSPDSARVHPSRTGSRMKRATSPVSVIPASSVETGCAVNLPPRPAIFLGCAIQLVTLSCIWTFHSPLR